MSSQDDNQLNILIPGRKIVAIFGFCFIREFQTITECLLEEVMVPAVFGGGAPSFLRGAAECCTSRMENSDCNSQKIFFYPDY